MAFFLGLSRYAAAPLQACLRMRSFVRGNAGCAGSALQAGGGQSARGRQELRARDGCPLPPGVAAISHSEWTVLLAQCCWCVFIGQARIMHSFEAGEYRRRDIPHRGIAQAP
jgi:hypothetical protein